MTTNADSETDELEEPKTTRVIFHNPEQKDTPEVYSRDKTAREHFEAALFVKREIGARRTLLFGDLIAAVVEVEKEDDPSRLIKICNYIIDGDLEAVQSKNIELKET